MDCERSGRSVRVSRLRRWLVGPVSSTPSCMNISIELESPQTPDVRALIEALDRYQAPLYPAESNHLLSLASLCAPDIRFFVARAQGHALGCAALRVFSEYGEIKRMFVTPEARGQRLGVQLLAALEARARQERLCWLRLETGIHQHEALRLYRVAGFRECEPFGEYRPDPLSVFMELRLDRS